MTCDRVRSRLDEYYDGELAGPDLELIGAHLPGCAACSAELESLERESALLARYDEESGASVVRRSVRFGRT
jgi:anti-sigma factor RsiW